MRQDFPILAQQINGHPLVYLDNAATTQKPECVIEAISHYYRCDNANVHRGVHALSQQATDAFERARSTVQYHIGAANLEEIIWVAGATDGINLVAQSWGREHIGEGDVILITYMEHHANIVPWHFLRERQGVVIKWVDVDSTGYLDPEAVIAAMGPKTKLVAVTHLSNVLGTVVDVKTICHAARERGIATLIDGSQAAVHMPVDVEDIGCDFYAITGHKLYGPSGSGAIFMKKARMAEMQPFLGGGDMIREVHKDEVTWNDAPMTFEAGTPGIVQQIGLGVALDYMMGIGMENIAAHEKKLRDYARTRLDGLNWLQVQGTTPDKAAIFSFTLDGAAHAHDISTILDKKGVAVRAGQHCTGPLMDHLGLTATCRASFAMYNTEEEVDKLVEALELAHDLFA